MAAADIVVRPIRADERAEVGAAVEGTTALSAQGDTQGHNFLRKKQW